MAIAHNLYTKPRLLDEFEKHRNLQIVRSGNPTVLVAVSGTLPHFKQTIDPSISILVHTQHHVAGSLYAGMLLIHVLQGHLLHAIPPHGELRPFVNFYLIMPM